MVVRAARAEIGSQQPWRRPSHGPGARSRSADPRLRLEPLPQTAACQSEAGGQAIPLPPTAPKEAPVSPVLNSRKHRPSSKPEARSFSQQPSPSPSACSAAGPEQVVPKGLLRRRSRSCTPSSSSEGWQPPESEGEDQDQGSIGAHSEQYESEEESQATEDIYSDDDRKAEQSRSCSERDEADSSCDPELHNLSDDLPEHLLKELQDIEAALASKEEELLTIEARESELSERFESSKRIAVESAKLAANLEANLARKHAEAEAIAEASGPHNSPRRASHAKPRQVKPQELKPAHPDLSDLVDGWSQARLAMGIADPRGSA